MKITIGILVGAMVLVIAGAIFAGPNLAEKLASLKPEAEGTNVRMQTVVNAELVEVVSAPGEVEPKTKVDIAARVSARITQLPFAEGDTVKKGDLICKLDDKDLKAALESSQARKSGEAFRLQSEQARLTGISSNLEFATRERERRQTLYDSGDISRRELDDALERERDLTANLDAATHAISVIESSLAGAQANIDQAMEALSYTEIVAPMDGVITALNMEVGEQVLGTVNNLGSVIMTIADLSRMILRGQVAESDIAAIKTGQTARIYINAYDDEEFVGSVTHVALQRTISPDGSGVFQTEVEIDLQGRRILSGLTANVDIRIQTHTGRVVESQAIVERLVEDLPDELRGHPLVDPTKRTTNVVYRVVDGETVCTPVVVGPSDLTKTLVSKGLDDLPDGDPRVVIGPFKVLEDLKQGTKVAENGTAQDADRDAAEDAAEEAPEEADEAS